MTIDMLCCRAPARYVCFGPQGMLDSSLSYPGIYGGRVRGGSV